MASLDAGSVVFTPNADFAGTASFEYTVTAGIATDVGLVTITVQPVNDAPVNSVPSAVQISFVQTAKVFSSARNNPITISDDARTNPVQVTLAATNGTITLGGTAGLNFATGDGDADPTTTFTGTTAEINTAMNGMSVTPIDFGTTLTITTNDQGNTGSGGALSDSDTVSFTVRVGPFTQTSSGVAHTCGLSPEGAVFCWGDDANGQLGNGPGGSSQIPARVLGVGGTGFLQNITQVSVGSSHSCAIESDGNAFCWGGDASGQLGNGGASAGSQTPVQVLRGTQAGTSSFLQNLTQISAGLAHSCAVISDGSAFCWGDDSFGQLGNGTENESQAPVQVSGVGGAGVLQNVTQISTGDAHGCAVTSDGSAFCWGDDTFGQLGNGAGNESQTPTRVLGVGGAGFLQNITQISAGNAHGCAVMSDGSAFCWGADGSGQLGNGAAGNSQIPTRVLGVGGTGFLQNITQISVGNAHSCAVASDGNALCWGADGSGRLGNGGGSVNSQTPASVLGAGGVGFLQNVTQISTGSAHSCAVGGDGNAFCWGSDGDGQLGTGGVSANSQAPAQVPTPGQSATHVLFAQVSTGGLHSCGVTAEGAVFCWGAAGGGRLGSGAAAGGPTPTQVLGVGGTGFLRNVAHVSAGKAHTCAVTNNGRVLCWGSDQFGQLGNGGASASSSTPVQVAGVGGAGFLQNAIQISAGDSHNCAVTSAGSAFCWGLGSGGALGNGAGVDSQAPAQVLGVGGAGFLQNVTQVSAGIAHGCAITSAGSAFCWGSNLSGEGGNGVGPSFNNVPVQVLGVGGVGFLSNVTQISAGDFYSCSVVSSGSAFCWGDDASGQLGNGGTGVLSLTPTQVLGVNGSGLLQNVTHISAGDAITNDRHSCARTSSGRPLCWGSDSDGQLGNPLQFGDRQAPILVLTGTPNTTSISVGGLHSCFTTSTGAAFCWGDNEFGQLGNPTLGESQFPAEVSAPPLL